MITVHENSKIYIFCPAKRVTGGTELAHQLVDYLIRKRKNAFIVYYENNKIVEQKIPNEFQNYNINICININDNEENIIVLPEVLFIISKKYKNTQFIFWWMSVDNFFSKSPFFNYAFFFNLYESIKLIYTRILNNENILTGFSLQNLKKIKNNNLHVYQSTYAKYFLLKNGFVDILPLSDYINSEFSISLDPKKIKENIILYNRAKGFRFTKKIIKKLPEYTFIPLVNLTRPQLADLFSKSKLYIDFGNHPGKDRMPREAVMYNCCVIVGKDGSAKFFEDVPIFKKYKIRKNKLEQITQVINNCINNYDDVIIDFDFYKRKILTEKRNFHQEIDDIFNLNNY
jgi:hypothetical protein